MSLSILRILLPAVSGLQWINMFFKLLCLLLLKSILSLSWILSCCNLYLYLGRKSPYLICGQLIKLIIFCRSLLFLQEEDLLLAKTKFSQYKQLDLGFPLSYEVQFLYILFHKLSLINLSIQWNPIFEFFQEGAIPTLNFSFLKQLC